MKICFVNPTKLQRPIYVIAKGLADRGHTCTVLQPTGGVQRYPAWPNVRILLLPSRYIPEIRYTLPPLRLEYTLIKDLVQQENYDLVHVQDYQYLTALPAIWARKRLGIPISMVSNALIGVDWQYGKRFFDLGGKFYTHTLGRYILKSYDRLFLLYQDLQDKTQQLLGSPAMPPMEVIPIGVDTSQYHPGSKQLARQKLAVGDQEMVLLFVGRLVAVKRVEMMIQLTQRLLDEGIPVSTIIVGGGSEEANLKKLAQPLGNAIHFAGAVPADQITPYYHAADAVILPSRSEGLPNVLLEASACGVPSIASDVGGISEIIQHERTGYLFPRDDFEAMVNYAKFLLQNSDLRMRMGELARQHVLAHFDWKTIIDRYEQRFANLIEGLI